MREETILDRLICGLRAKGTPLDGQVRPAAILWTDPKCDWLPLTELILERVREFLVLGDYQPERRTGPRRLGALRRRRRRRRAFPSR